MATAMYKESPYTKAHKNNAFDIKYNDFEKLVVKREHYPRVNVALIGLGRIGVMYLRKIFLNTDLNLRYIIVSPRQNSNELRKKYEVSDAVIMTSDVNMALSDSTLHAVIIATSTVTHVNLILASLNAGKAVYCEKPISESVAGVKKCYKAANTVKLPLFCAFNRRYDTAYAGIQHRVRSGEVGHVQTIKSVSRDSPIIPKEFIEPSGGIFDDFAVHDVDLLLWVVGEVPNKVYVMGSALIKEFEDANDYDNMIISLSFPSGTLGTIDLNRFSPYGYDQRVEVFGDKGMLSAGHKRPSNMVCNDGDGSHHLPMYYSFPSRYDQAFEAEVKHFVDLVRGKTAVGVTEKQILAVSKVISACKESDRTGSPVVLEWEKDETPEY